MCRMQPLQSLVVNCLYAFASFFFGSSSLQADMQISPGSVSGIEINTSLLSAAEKEVYQTAISVLQYENIERLIYFIQQLSL